MAEEGDQNFVPKSQKPLSPFYDGERERERCQTEGA